LEDYARVIDYLPQGHPEGPRHRREALAYGIGEDEFKLFELVSRDGVEMVIGEGVYIGKDLELRDKVQHVKRRIGYEELTVAAQNELPFVLEEIVEAHEERYLRFYNEAQAITTRFHMLELIPGLGKKTMWGILEERKEGLFTSFEDLTKRVPTLHRPARLLAKRTEMELADPAQKYHIFVSR
jgi:putative nucleotide binding protein